MMTTCPECDSPMTRGLCKACGWSSAPPADSKTDPKTPRCCLCKSRVSKSGWCNGCDCWPINIIPLRWHGDDHPVRPDGFCDLCGVYRLTRLLPGKGRWEDTGEVPSVLPKLENKARLRALLDTITDKQLAAQRRPRDLDAEKAACREIDRLADIGKAHLDPAAITAAIQQAREDRLDRRKRERLGRSR